MHHLIKSMQQEYVCDFIYLVEEKKKNKKKPKQYRLPLVFHVHKLTE